MRKRTEVENLRELLKDFYNDLPSMVCEILDDEIIPKYLNEKWFGDAWEEYRQHIKIANMADRKMPQFIFKKYIKKAK